MLTRAQENWIAQFPDNDHVTIFPPDPTAPWKFEAVKRKIHAVLGPLVRVEHCGATSLGVCGQDEINVFIPVSEDEFNTFLTPLTAAFGPLRSYYRRESARFVTFENGKHIDITLINANSPSWLNGRKFECYLKSHPEALHRYQQLKESSQGMSTQAYYRRKIEFINAILAESDSEPHSERAPAGSG